MSVHCQCVNKLVPTLLAVLNAPVMLGMCWTVMEGTVQVCYSYILNYYTDWKVKGKAIRS